MRAGSAAVFLDRDGVINAMIRIGDELDSPLRAEHVSLLPRAGEAIRLLNQTGAPVIVVSNQPVIAKGKTSPGELSAITERIVAGVGAAGGVLDAIYYCLHHPLAVVEDLRVVCECRKPAPGLLRQAAREHGLDLARCYMVGDRLTDVQAGREAGCTTVLVGSEDIGNTGGRPAGGPALPHHAASDLFEAVRWILVRLSNDQQPGVPGPIA